MAEILKLAYGKPETIAFKFDSGKDVTGKFGPQVAFTAVDRDGRDQILYLDPEPASDVEHKLQELGIRTREYFRIVKIKQPHGGTTIQVERIAAPTNTASAPASHSNSAPAPVQPAPAITTPAATTTERAQVNTAAPVGTRYMSFYAAAIDTLIEAKAYAQREGLALEIRCEDVRCLAATMMIDQQRGGR